MGVDADRAVLDLSASLGVRQHRRVGACRPPGQQVSQQRGHSLIPPGVEPVEGRERGPLALQRGVLQRLADTRQHKHLRRAGRLRTAQPVEELRDHLQPQMPEVQAHLPQPDEEIAQVVGVALNRVRRCAPCRQVREEVLHVIDGQAVVPHHGVRDRTALGQPQPLHCERHTTPQTDMDRRTEPVHVAPKGAFMATSWTSKTPARLMDIVDDTGELLPDGTIIDPHRPVAATGAVA